MRLGILMTAIAIAIAAPSMAADTAPYVSLTTGNHIFPMCEPAASPVRKNSCAWYVKGIIEGVQVYVQPSQQAYSLLCMPDDLQGSQLTAIFGKYLEDYPEQRHEPAIALVIRSMTAAFPCRH